MELSCFVLDVQNLDLENMLHPFDAVDEAKECVGQVIGKARMEGVSERRGFVSRDLSNWPIRHPPHAIHVAAGELDEPLEQGGGGAPEGLARAKRLARAEEHVCRDDFEQPTSLRPLLGLCGRVSLLLLQLGLLLLQPGLQLRHSGQQLVVGLDDVLLVAKPWGGPHQGHSGEHHTKQEHALDVTNHR